MFIRKRSHGYYRGTEQHSGRGDYLALFSWNDYKALDELIAGCLDCTQLSAEYDRAIERRNTGAGTADDHVRIRIGRSKCDAHNGIRSGLPIPVYSNGKPMLWAIIRSCSLAQCGHFMMGTIRIGGTSITVSGPCGSDGLPMDYQKVPAKYRHLLIEVPEDVAAVYWTDNGHNDIGSARTTLLDWALTLPRRR